MALEGALFIANYNSMGGNTDRLGPPDSLIETAIPAKQFYHWVITSIMGATRLH